MPGDDAVWFADEQLAGGIDAFNGAGCWGRDVSTEREITFTPVRQFIFREMA